MKFMPYPTSTGNLGFTVMGHIYKSIDVLHNVERVISMLKQHPVLELQAGGETQQNGWNVILLGGKHLQTLLPRSQIGRVHYIEQDLVYKYFWNHVVPLLDGSTGQFS